MRRFANWLYVASFMVLVVSWVWRWGATGSFNPWTLPGWYKLGLVGLFMWSFAAGARVAFKKATPDEEQNGEDA